MTKKTRNFKKAALLIIAFLGCGLLFTSLDDSCEEGIISESDLNGASTDQGTAGTGDADGSGTASASTDAVSQDQTGAAGSTAAAKPAAGDPATGSTASTTGSTTDTGAGSQDKAGAAGSQAGDSTAAGSSTAAGGSTSTAAPETGTAGASQSSGSNGSIAEIGGKDWKLVELRTSTKSLQVDRKKLESENMGDFFTFNIGGDRVSGKGAPNRYTAGYQTGDNNALTIQSPASTLMAAIYDPEKIREREYFDYLVRVTRWKLNQGRLELYTVDETGKEAVLIYVN